MTLEIRNVDEIEGEQLGQLVRKVLFAPSLGNSKYMRMAMVTGAPGARSAIHTHLGNEAIYTWQGEVLMDLGGQEYHLTPGTALAVPPDMTHPVHVISDVPWVSICFYCDECSVLQGYRAAGGSIRSEVPCVVDSAGVEPVALGELCRRVLFTPSCDCVNFQRMALVEGTPGAQGAAHVHLGNECFFSLGGQVTQMIDLVPHVVDARSGMAVPPDVLHQPVVTDKRGWQAVAAFCDECPALKEARKA